MKIKFKLFPKSLRVYTVEKEVVEGFGIRLKKEQLSSVANPILYNLVLVYNIVLRTKD